MPINILLADDHEIIIDGLTALIRGILPDAHIVRATDLDMVLRHLAQSHIHLAICDINMPGANHFRMVNAIRTISPDVKLLILSAYKQSIYARRYLKEGADAYLHKNTASSSILDTIVALLQGTYAPPAVAGLDPASGPRESVTESSPLEQLSNRELEVAQLLIRGLGILEIANTLDIHVNTVSTYKSRVFEKMNVLSIPELVAVFNTYSDWCLE